MAVTHEAQNSASGVASSTALPGFNVTPAGTSRFMLIGARYENDVGATTITVGGAAATKIAHVTNGSNLTTELWYFSDPAASLLAIAGTLAVASSGRVVGASCFGGVDIAGTPLGTHATGSGNTAAASVAVSGGGADGVCFAVVGARFPAASILAGDTVSWEIDDGGNDMYVGGSYLAGASGTLDWTLGAVANWGMIGVALLPLVASGATPRIFGGTTAGHRRNRLAA